MIKLLSRKFFVASFVFFSVLNPIILNSQEKTVYQESSVASVKQKMSTPVDMLELVYDSVPLEYSDHVQIYLPKERQLVTDNKILFRGLSRLDNSKVFINGVPLRLDENGRFYSEIKINNYGPKVYYITFLTPNNQFFIVRRYFYRLYVPYDLKQFNYNRRIFTYFFNTDFVYKRKKLPRLSDPVTRLDIVYFVSKLMNLPIKSVSSKAWFRPYINYMRNNNLMHNLIDGNFHPFDQALLLDYIILLARVKEKLDRDNMLLLRDSDTYINDIAFSSIDPNHWVAKYVGITSRYNFIKYKATLRLDEPLIWSTFIGMVAHMPEIEAQFEKIANVSIPDNIAIIEKSYTALLDAFKDSSLPSSKKEMIYLSKPKEKYISVFSESISFEGQVYPSKPFIINNVKITPSKEGDFSVNIFLRRGKNDILVSAYDTSITYRVVRLEPYSDLQGDDMELEITALKAAGILTNEDFFKPNETLTRILFSTLIENFFSTKLPDTTYLDRIDDIAQLNSDKKRAIKRMLSNNVFSLDGTNIYPNKIMTRLDGVVALVRVLDLLSYENNKDLISEKNKNIPYWDIQKNQEGYEETFKAYKMGLLEKTHYFHPKKPLTKRDFVVMCLKTKLLQAKWKGRLYYD